MALRAAEDLLQRIEQDSWKPHLVMGLGRSGALWAGWLAGNLGSLPIAVIDRKYIVENNVRTLSFPAVAQTIKALKEIYGENPQILIVEGSSTSGQPFVEVKKQFTRLWPKADVKFAALYANRASPFKVDYAARLDIKPYPEAFPWHHRGIYRRHFGAS